MKPWQRIEPTTVLHEGRQVIVEKTFIKNDGNVFKGEIATPENSKAAIVIALTPDKKAIIARQFRCGPEQVMDELPGGLVEDHETPQDAAIRELREETGYNIGKIEPLGKVYKNAWINMAWYYFIATDCRLSLDGQNLDENEEVEVDLISIDQLIKNAKAGTMTDIDAVLLAYDILNEYKEK